MNLVIYSERAKLFPLLSLSVCYSPAQLTDAMDACARIRGVPIRTRAPVRKEVWKFKFFNDTLKLNICK